MSTDKILRTEAEAIAALAAAARPEPRIVQNSNGREFLILGDRHVDISEPHAIEPNSPWHIAQAVTLQTAQALGDYVNRYKDDRSVIFADVERNRIVASLDFHLPGDETGNVEHAPQPRAHSATLTLAYSEEWKAWTHLADRGLVDQLTFARFLEENAADIVAPSGADLLEICRDMQAVRKVNFKKAVRTNTDHENFEFSDETEARTSGGLEVPTRFALRFPVYFGGPAVDVMAYLRWKLDDGSLNLGVKLHRAEHVRQAAFISIVDAVTTATGRPSFIGRAD